jgi:hypothetical protein
LGQKVGTFEKYFFACGIKEKKASLPFALFKENSQ